MSESRRDEVGTMRWLLDAPGLPIGDPVILLRDQGSLLPGGGLDHGHKGYATPSPLARRPCS